MIEISIHALLAESDPRARLRIPPQPIFQSTLSLRRATWVRGFRCWFRILISIHALLAESDARLNHRIGIHRDFNPRSPCGERPGFAISCIFGSVFQSTLSLRRATLHKQHRRGWLEFQSTLSLRRATRRGPSMQRSSSLFQSTLSLRRATTITSSGSSSWIFQSTLSLRRATPGDRRGGGRRCISIHALLAESDRNPPAWTSARARFQSTLSLRRATWVRTIKGDCGGFQSTLSLRRATRLWGNQTPDHWISIHALLAESDQGVAEGITSQSDFNPRSPCGERPAIRSSLRTEFRFQSTLSLRRATDSQCRQQYTRRYFNPRSPCGERRWALPGSPFPREISIHALLAESDFAPWD